MRRHPPGNRRLAAPPPRRRPGATLSGALHAAGAASLRAAHRLRKPALVIAVLAFAAGATLLVRRYLLSSSHFVVRAVLLPPLHHESEAALRRHLAVTPGSNIFRVDLRAVARRLEQDPWVASAHVRRELPGTIVVDVVEREPAAAVILGNLYLADAAGTIFKRATPGEARGLPVVTGLSRDGYLADEVGVRTSIRRAIEVWSAWQKGAARPPIGEVHFAADGTLSVVFASGTTEVELGDPDDGDDPAAALARFDAVWSALGPQSRDARVIHLDDETRPDRVTVRLLATTQGHVAQANQ